MKKRLAAFRLDEDMYEIISRYAKDRRMTLTHVLVQLVLNFIEEKGLGDERFGNSDLSSK